MQVRRKVTRKIGGGYTFTQPKTKASLRNIDLGSVVSKILGHSKTSVTLDTYGHIILEMQEDAARVMDDLVIPIKVDVREFNKIDIESDENR